MIGFLFKSAFWLSVALLFIPLPPSSEDGAAQVGALDAFFAAREAVSDMSEICARKPDVCEVGGALVGSMGARAREGARLAYEALGGHLDEPEAPTVLAEPAVDTPSYADAMITGSVPMETIQAF